MYSKGNTLIKIQFFSNTRRGFTSALRFASFAQSFFSIFYFVKN